jgi:hypothetical protein
MTTVQRRTLMKVVLRAPVVGVFAKWVLFGWDTPIWKNTEANERFERKFLAVRVLRLINTAQYFYFEEFHRYADLDELWRAETVDKYLDSSSAEKVSLGRSLFRILQFGESEVVPGWRLRFELKDEGRNYRVTLEDITGAALGAFATDHDAAIFEGEGIAAMQDAGGIARYGPALLVAGRQINSVDARPRTLAALFKAVSLVPSEVLAACSCTQYPCCCACSCQGGGGPLCKNCGCLSCVWCCCPY